MASGNLTTRTALTTPQPSMLLYAGLSPFGTTDDRKITANDLFSEITANITDLSVQFGNGASATVSAANKGKMRYLDGTGFQVSENGAAYATITSLGNTTTGTGAIVRAASPTLTTPALGTPTALILTNATGLPVASGISGLGSGVASALAVNTGSAGAVVLFNGAGGTPSSLTLTNATGLPPLTGIVGWPANAAGVLTNNGSGTLSWGAGGSTSPGGSTTNAQYNNAGAFGGSTGITFTATQATITGAKFVGSLRDANDLILIAPTATTSAVNYFTMANSATGQPVVFGAAGSDTNISVQLVPKGSGTSGGQVVIPGGGRFDNPGLTFAGLLNFGLHQNSGGGWMSVNCNNFAFCTAVRVAISSSGSFCFGSDPAVPIDDPPGQTVGIKWLADYCVRVHSVGALSDFTGAGNLMIGTSAGAIGTNGRGVLGFCLSTAPSTSPADVFQIYSADWNGAGTAAMHVRNEEGHIIVLARQTVTGSRGGNAALADLLTKLANIGLIVDSTS